MKTFTIALTALIFGVGMLSAQTATTPSGSGTSGDPYQVASLDNLYWISQNSSSWSSYFLQTANIDASTTSSWNSGAGWAPIAPFTTLTGTYFTGTYNGGGYAITGLTINNTSAYTGWGLFGVIWGGTISNLSVTNANVTGAGVVGIIAGLVVGKSVFTNCITSGTVSGSIGSQDLGNGTGGLIGCIYYYSGASTITNCHSSATVSSSHKNVGGLVGQCQGSIRLCYATGNVTSSYSSSNNEICVGGLVGDNQGPLNKSYASGAVSGESCIGGLAGRNSNEDGYHASVTIDSCYATGVVSVMYGNNSYAGAGGLVGKNDTANIRYSYATGNVVGFNNSSNVGGLVGIHQKSGLVSYCYATGAVSGEANLGGLIGQTYATSTAKDINGDGLINADDNIVIVSDCYARGNATGTANNVGGLVGRNSGSTIKRTYATGVAYSSGTYGGIIGSNENNAAISNSFWDTTTSGLSSGYGSNSGTFSATGETTALMKTQSTFTDASWDFSTVWTIQSGTNDGYPFIGTSTATDLTVTKAFGDEISVYPNPVTDVFTINGIEGTATLQIINTNGQVVKNELINSGQKVSVGDLPQGIYIVKLTTENGVAEKKLVKR
jgi:hypothetical protein